MCVVTQLLQKNFFPDQKRAKLPWQITSNEQSLHIGRADGAPGFELLVEGIIKDFSTTDILPKPEIMNEYNSDWDALYPFSSFLSAYKVPLPVPEGYVSPWANPNDQTFTVSAINNIYNAEAGTRSLTLEVKHPGIIWSGKQYPSRTVKRVPDFLINENTRSDCV